MSSDENLAIVTIDSSRSDVLKKKAELIKDGELGLAKEIGEKLFLALKPYMPAAGLAAPQIGISKALFIYSFDRDPKNLVVVINPSFTPAGKEKKESWEGCLSVILSNGIYKLAKIPRYEKIKVSYMNQEGKKIEKVLEGFAAKVFQHEYDHLQGIENIYRKDALIKDFDSKEGLVNFMVEVKKEDAKRY